MNFPQRTLMTYAPAVTGAAWGAPPRQESGPTERDWLKLLPALDLAQLQLNTLYALGSVHYRRLGDYLDSDFPYLRWLQDPRVIGTGGPLDRFRQALEEVEDTIRGRNQIRIPYEFLLPSRIPPSINI